MRGFDRLRVLDISTIIAGPFASLNFAKRGSDVIHVELPDVGDGARNLATVPDAAGSWYKFLSQNKSHITLRLSTAEGVQLFKQLVAQSDIVIENFRPGTLERWGIGPDVLEEVNGSLILVRISGFGQWGPDSHRPGYGTLAEAMSTFPFVTGFADGPPMLPGTALADTYAGYAAYCAALEALYLRAQPDLEVGFQCVDVPLYGAMVFSMGMHAAEYETTGRAPQRRGNRLGNAPRNAVQSADGQWLVYSAQSNNIVRAIVGVLGLHENSKYHEDKAGYLYGEELDALIADWVAARSADEVLKTFDSVGIPSGAIYSAGQLVQDRHMLARSDIEFVHDVSSGRDIRLPGLPYRFEAETMSDDDRPVTGGSIGQDNADVYGRLCGLDAEELDALQARGTI